MKRHRHHAVRPGFTIIELVVAIGLTSVLLFLVSRVFFETQQVLTFGIKTSNALAHARAVGTQLKTDTDAMLPSNATLGQGGYLVIFNGSTEALVKQPDGTERLEVIRTDQLVFIRSGGGTMTSLTPVDNSTLSSDFSSDTAKVWYGHARRANTDGTAGVGFGTGLDTFANDWVLARHALLMAPTDAAGNDVIASASAVYLDDTRVTASTLQRGGSYPHGPQDASFGFSDLTNQTFLGGGNVSETLANTGTEADYLDQAFAEVTLRVLTQIDTNIDAFASWQSAQTHSYLAANVSDFIVEFAGDYNTPTDGEIDTDDGAGNPTGGADDPIFWYSVNSLPAATTPAIETSVNLAPFEYAESADGPQAAFIFRVDDTANWPSLMRIRYRIHDPQGRLGSFDDATNSTISGRFFEHILYVPPPVP